MSECVVVERNRARVEEDLVLKSDCGSIKETGSTESEVVEVSERAMKRRGFANGTAPGACQEKSASDIPALILVPALACQSRQK